jgi:GNAT superfamily N-acetyltransferase
VIQPFKESDLARISHLQPVGWESILPFFRFYLDAAFCIPLKIEERGSIVATGAVVLHAETAWLAHIIVEPQMRRKGLGLLVTQELIALAEKHGRHVQLLIATSMGAPLYECCDFRVSCDYRFYHHSATGEMETSPQIRALEHADRVAVESLDKRASGEDRHLLLSRYCDSGWVYADSDNKEILGYFLPELGEGTIVAQDAKAGNALQELRLATVNTAPVLPADNHAANALLRDRGFKLKSTAVRMVRNGQDPQCHDMIYNRIGGHLG